MRRCCCRLTSPFFGLGPNYRPVLYDQIFDLMYYGKFGLTFTEVYGMPVFLRNYYYRKLADIRRRENEEYEKESKKAKR